jgi:hypothetical protein
VNIIELFKNEQIYWHNQNINFFGVGLLDETKPFSELQKELNEYCNRHWNGEKPCKVARYINNGILDKEASKKIKNTFRLELNIYNMCIDVFAQYHYNNTTKEFKICAMPTPSVDLCWIINKSHYVPRVTAVRDYYTLVGKVDFETIKGEAWTYNIREDSFTCNSRKNPFDPSIEEIFTNHLSARSRALLQSSIDEPLTIDTFKQALRQLPIFENNSIFNYKFSRTEYFEDLIINGGKYAQPSKRVLLGINQMIVSKSKQYSNSGEKLEGCLVRSESPIFSLENFRTTVNVYDGEFKPVFTYTDTTGFFDSFKTVTSGSAGRQRLLLDNIIVKQGMLWVRHEDGTETNMFEHRLNPQSKRLSVLSSAPFCNNDKPKRIMMNAKLTAQSVALKDEIDNLTHRILARVGFADLEGYSYADSIIISESFAERLRTYSKDILYLERESDEVKTLEQLYKKGELVPNVLLRDLYLTTNLAILDSYENIRVAYIDYVDEDMVRVFLTWEIPFRLGDKITNLHGAKGTVGIILPDSKMPQLMKQAGHMKPGPLEVIISGFSTIRRGSLGQIFEAWALASGIQFEEGENDFISMMIDKYSKQMQDFAKNSIVKFNGERTVIPLGINHIMRLYHHASTHISISAYDSDYKKTLKLGEMEKFNLVSSGCTNILKELSIRSIHKYVGASRLVSQMEETRELPTNPILSLKLASIMKSIGYDIRLNGKSLIKSDLSKVEFDDTDIANFNNLDINV